MYTRARRRIQKYVLSVHNKTYADCYNWSSSLSFHLHVGTAETRDEICEASIAVRSRTRNFPDIHRKRYCLTQCIYS